MREAYKYDDRRNRWIMELGQHRGKNITAVAAANKNARIAWAVLSKKGKLPASGMMITAKLP